MTLLRVTLYGKHISDVFCVKTLPFFRKSNFRDKESTYFEKANMTADQINKVILVGGSSRIPKIKETLENMFTGAELNFSLNADEAIAIGATLRAKQIITNDILNIRLNEANAQRLGK